MNSEDKLPPLNPTQSANQTLSAQKLVAILLAVTPEELQNNPEAARSAFVKIYTKLQEVLGDSTSENSTQVEAARAHLHSLRETLRTQGFDPSEDIEKLPDLLQEILSSPKIEQYLQEMVVKLQTLADKSDQSPEAVGQTINEIIQTLNKELFGEEESRRKQERRQEYKKLADDAIAQSFSKLEIPSFAGGFLKMETSQQSEDEPK
jgi:uncharacterized membrane-anchored protein YjiN (DUF445 family)